LRFPTTPLRLEGIRATFETSIGVTLLRAILGMFKEGVDCLLSKEIIAELTADPEQPWAEYKRDKAITQKQLAALLRGYRIFPSTVHPPEPAPHGRGYNRSGFEDAWGRLLSVLPGGEVEGQASRARCSGHAPRHSVRLCGGAVSAPRRHHQTAAV
jgi:hypothetical protein